MPFPVASGSTAYPTGASAPSPAYSGTFIPQIWSGKLIEKFYASTVLAAISNTDYEGEIKNKGDQVIIRTKPTITIRAYSADLNLAVDRPVGSTVTLYVNQGIYFNEALDDVFRLQSDLNLLSMWADDASEQMKIAVDSAVLLSIIGQSSSYNMGLAAGRISGTINLGVTGTPLFLVPRDATTGQVEIVDLMLRLGLVLDEQNIPETGRWIVLPTWAATMIKQSELRQVYLSGDPVSMLRNGRIGQIDRFTVYASNLLPYGTGSNGMQVGEWAILAGHAHALTFASQITEIETLRSEFSFANLLRGLQVYGSQVVDGTALSQAIVTH